MLVKNNVKKDLVEQGCFVLKNLLNQDEADLLGREIKSCLGNDAVSGIRNLEKKVKAVYHLTRSPKVLDLAETVLNGKPQMVRAIYFNKTSEANWGVVWHQDKTIAVDRQTDIAGWGPWTIKDGVQHVQPDINVLERMVTIRIHLDPADESNGCLKVIPRSHQFGILTQNQVDELKVKRDSVSCIVERGDAVLMRPHVLHSSNKADKPAQRRVVHLEYSDYTLPDGLSWA
ncbi:MAG: phytanoyl-CoA dioxygenase family protein [Candidatus Omnitrophota bacterium]